MRIAYDAKRAFKNFTGLGNYSRAVIDIMSRFYPENDYVLYTPPYKPVAALKGFASGANITVCEPKGIWRTLHSTWRSFKIAKLIKKDKVGIYHGLSHELPSGIQHTGVKSVVTMHDLIVLRYPHLYKAIDRKIYIKKYRAACEHANLIIAISKQTKQDLIELMGVDERKIRLVYQGCDSQFQVIKTDKEKQEVKQKYNLPDKYILNVGTIEPRKSLATIVQALANLPDDIHLVAMGKATDYMKTVQAEIDRLNLQKRVHILQGVRFTDFPAIYQQAQVFVYPSVFEGFGIPILEALHSRIPVVAANTSSLPEVGGNAALYIEPGDYVQLAKHIQNILSDANLRNSMVEKGLVQAAKFNDDEIAKNMWAVYNELMNI